MSDDKARAASMASLDRALTRVIRTHEMLPEEPTVLDVVGAYQEIAFWILSGAIDAAKEAADGEAPGRES